MKKPQRPKIKPEEILAFSRLLLQICSVEGRRGNSMRACGRKCGVDQKERAVARLSGLCRQLENNGLWCSPPKFAYEIIVRAKFGAVFEYLVRF
jgi:hypothetical protein